MLDNLIDIVILDVVFAVLIGVVVTQFNAINSSLVKYTGSQAFLPLIVLGLFISVFYANITLYKHTKA